MKYKELVLYDENGSYEHIDIEDLEAATPEEIKAAATEHILNFLDVHSDEEKQILLNKWLKNCYIIEYEKNIME